MKAYARLMWLVGLWMHALYAEPIHQIYVEMGTGDDDLRAGSELVLTLHTQDGRQQKIDLIQGRRLADRTRYTRAFKLNPAIERNLLQQADVNWIPGRCDAPCQTDQWWLTEFILHAGYGPGAPVLVNAAENARAGGSVLVLPHKFTDREERVVLFHRRDTVAMCSADRDCDDGRFCNGVERCSPASSVADARGCVASTSPMCASGISCNETAKRCDTICEDRDGDGAQAAWCGGDDCDDNDANRYPGNVEIWDDRNHDEDCDSNTTGFLGRYGTANQFCNGRDSVVIVDAQERRRDAKCMAGTVCLLQPAGTGVCASEPPGYQAPGPFTGPQPQTMPSVSSPKKPPIKPTKKGS